MPRDAATRSRHAVAALTASLALSAVLAGPASGTARVFLDPGDGRLTVTVDAVAGGDGNHGVFVEPFVDATRDGFRAKQTALGVPAIVAAVGPGGAPCFTNPVFNDVVCDGPRGSIAMTMGDGDDRVTLSESGGGGGDTCFNIADAPGVPATVALGDGADRLDVVTVSGLLACGGSFDIQIPLTVEGNGGNDSIDGGRLNDTLLGGAGSDTMNGLDGDDVLDGGTTEAVRPDILFGGQGRDALRGGPDRDTIDGGPGLEDTALYNEKTAPVTVDIGTPPTPSAQGDLGDDGEEGERDEVRTTIEHVVGGQAGDTLTGDADRNILTGNGGPDRLSGGVGADDLLGNAGGDRLLGGDNADLLSGLEGADELVGGPGVDRFFGGADGDVIDARDGLIENQISCGEGATTGRDEDLLRGRAAVRHRRRPTRPGAGAAAARAARWQGRREGRLPAQGARDLPRRADPPQRSRRWPGARPRPLPRAAGRHGLGLGHRAPPPPGRRRRRDEGAGCVREGRALLAAVAAGRWVAARRSSRFGSSTDAAPRLALWRRLRRAEGHALGLFSQSSPLHQAFRAALARSREPLLEA